MILTDLTSSFTGVACHQENHLIEHWTVQQNLELVGASLQKIESLMAQVSLDKSKLISLVSKLSGGEKQRVSLIRLLVQKPAVALLDEPTAHLDDKNTEQILKLLKSEMPSATILIVSHDSRLSKHFDSPILFQELNR